MYSYGSGAASSMFSLRVNSKVSFEYIYTNVNKLLNDRILIDPREYEKMMDERILNYTRKGYRPKMQASYIRPNAYILQEIKERGERLYTKYTSTQDQPSSPLKHNDKVEAAAGSRRVEGAGRGGNERIMMVARHMGVPISSRIVDSGYDKFYKKTMEERRRIVGVSNISYLYLILTYLRRIWIWEDWIISWRTR